MDAYRDSAPIWDFTNPANGYTQMQDIDFMALLDKQYSGNARNSTDGNGVTLPGQFHASDPAQQPNQQASSSNTSPSNDTPSPSDSHESHYDDGDGPAAKRKATSEASEGPSSKTMKGATASASTTSRRKSTGNPAKDENRLLKRKEQNRAAQRAFRERKEKHVRDLEDKVAALEAKNEEAAHENENLRDLLSRLQTENVMLKQGHFTFSMPRESVAPFSADSTSFPQNMPPSTRSSFAAPQPPSRSKSPNLSNPLDWSSLTSFDPSRLNLLDDLSQHQQQQQQQQQPTATDSAMQLDFGFGPSGLASNTPFTTLASNPMFMSFASSFDTTPPADSPSNSSNLNSALNFDMNSLTSWPVQENVNNGSLDDLFQGYAMNNNHNIDFSFLTSPASISPVAHHISPPLSTGNAQPLSLSSSPSSSSTDPLYTPKDSPPHQDFDPNHDTSQCPKTKAELVKCIEKSGPSPFAPVCTSTGVRKSVDGSLGAMISCEGSSSFPKTQKNDQNVEVLSAWRSITSNPKFKDTDISELCAEFTAKARCDGTKVVLEPASVDSIIETLSKKQQSSPPEPPQMQQ